MITLIEPEEPRLGRARGEPLILAAIQALTRTAGPGLGREFWLVTGGPRQRAPLGAVCRVRGSILATAVGESAVRETADFLKMMGQPPATVDRGLAGLLPGKWARFPVLRYTGEMPEEVPLAPPSVMALVDCNIAAGAVPPALREDVYAELHLRQRRGALQVFLIPGENGRSAAGACIQLGRDHAVVGDLACPPQKRGRGYGSAALSAAVRGAMAAGKTPLLACGEALVPFYAGRGFVPAGEVYERRAAAVTPFSVP